MLIILTLSFIPVTIVSHAQKYTWSVGYRSGIELLNLNLNSKKDFKENNAAWVNEIYATRMIGKHFEVEGNLRYWQKKYHNTSIYFDEPIGSGMSESTQYVNNLYLQLHLKYHFINRERYSFYVLGGTSVRRTIDKLKEQRTNSTTDQTYSNIYIEPLSIFSTLSAGLGLNYNINKRILISGTAILNYKTDQAMSMLNQGNYNNCSGNILLGIGYRF